MAKARKMGLCDDEGCDFHVPYPASPEDRFLGEQLDYMRTLHPEATDPQLRQMVLQEWNDDLSEEQKFHYLEEYEGETKVWLEEHEAHHTSLLTEGGVKTEVMPTEGSSKKKQEQEEIKACTIPNFKKKGKYFVCMVCEKLLKNHKNAVEHSEKHLGLDKLVKYICPKCNKEKKTNKLLRWHLRVDHGCSMDVAEIEKFKQVKDKNGSWTKQKEDLRTTKKRKKKVKMIGDKIDPVIPKALENFISLGSDCYSCVACEKKIKGKDKATKHRELHLDEAFEYVCPKCGKVRKDKFTAQKHLRVDHGLAIEIAEMAKFKRPRTGEEAFEYACSKCSKVRKDKFSMQNHLRKVHRLNYEIAEIEMLKND